MKGIVPFSIRQPMLVNLLTIGILIAGLVAWKRMPREIFPEIARDTVTITTIYPGVAPEEVEKLVTIPIERSVATVDDVETITARSSEGRSVIQIELKEDVDDPNRVLLDIQSAVARVSNLPADLPADPSVRGLKRQIPVMWLALSAALPEKELRVLASDLKADLEEIRGVSQAVIYGVRKVQITVEVEPARLAAARVSIAQVMRAIRQKHADVSGGTIRTARGEYLVRTVGRFSGAEEVRHIVVRAGPKGVTTVGDLARVTEGFEERTFESRVFGRPSAYAVVYKNEKADAIRVCARVRAYLERTRDRYPEGAGVVTLWDSSRRIERRQSTMYQNGLMGLVLVIILLFLFLDWRTALLTALGIPVSFFGTFVVMYWVFGITLNMVTMFALIMVLGMLVDDAIIVVENVYRHLMMGRSRLMAALLGASEVVWPVIAAVATTVVAYLMLLELPGHLGKVLAAMPLVAAAALLVSLVEALFVLPSHLREFARRPAGVAPVSSKEAERILAIASRRGVDALEDEGLVGSGDLAEGRGEARWFLGLQRGFRWVLQGLVRFWYVALPVAFLGMAFGGKAIVSRVGYRPFPETTVDRFDVGLELSVGTKLSRTRKAVQVLERALGELPKDAVESYICDVGSLSMGRRQTRYGTHLAKCQVRMAKDGKGSLSAHQVIARLRPVVARLPGLEKYEIARRRSGPDTGEPIQIEVRGNDDRVIRKIAGELLAYGRTLDGVEDLHTDLEAGKRELRIHVDEGRAAELGLDVSTIGTAVRNAFGGGLATRMQRGEDEIDVVVRFPDRLRHTTADVESLLLRSPTGGLVPFRAVAHVTEGVGPSSLSRVDRKRTVTLYGSVDEKKITAEQANRKLESFAAGLRDRYPGYQVRLRGEQEESRKLQEGLWDAFYLGVLAIFIILATIFRSVLQTLVILLAVPFAAFGVLVGLRVHGMPITLIGLLGAVALLGIVVNDSLVLVDFANQARARGESLWEAAVDGGVKRLRPILLTTITTCAGLLPMALGWFGSEEFLAPMAITIVWGLAFATLGTLLVVPCALQWSGVLGRSFWLSVGRGREETPVPAYLGVSIHAMVVGLAVAAITRLPWAALSVPAGVVAVVFGTLTWAQARRGAAVDAKRRSRQARFWARLAVWPWVSALAFALGRSLLRFVVS